MSAKFNLGTEIKIYELRGKYYIWNFQEGEEYQDQEREKYHPQVETGGESLGCTYLESFVLWEVVPGFFWSLCEFLFYKRI